MREANRRLAGLTSGSGLGGKGHPDLDTALAAESERVGIDSGRTLGQLLAAPPSAGSESNSYKRTNLPSPGEIPGTVAKFSQPRIPVPDPQQREEHAPRAELRVDQSTQAHSPRRWGEGRLERGPGSWRGANWESGVVCWLRPLPEGGGERYISAVVALDVLFRNGFAVRTQVGCGCGFRRPRSWSPAPSGLG